MFTQKLVYVCSPVKGNVAYNIQKAREYCKEVFIAGYIPLAPHIAFDGVLNDDASIERETALAAGLQLLKKCDELWQFGDIISSGMAAEIEAAKRLSIPVKKVIFNGGVAVKKDGTAPCEINNICHGCVYETDKYKPVCSKCARNYKTDLFDSGEK